MLEGNVIQKCLTQDVCYKVQVFFKTKTFFTQQQTLTLFYMLSFMTIYLLI